MQKIKPVALSQFDPADLFCDCEVIVKVEYELEGRDMFSTHRIDCAVSYDLVEEYVAMLTKGPADFSSYAKVMITSVQINQTDHGNWHKVFGLDTSFEQGMYHVFDEAFQFVDENQTAMNFFIDKDCLIVIARYLDIDLAEADKVTRFIKDHCESENQVSVTYAHNELEIEVCHGSFS